MNFTKHQKQILFRILIAGGIFLGLCICLLFNCLPQNVPLRLALFLVPYAIVGWDVWRKAVQNLAGGRLLDENFLMCIATVGALVLSEYPEAVFVMLFYQIGELFESIAVGKSRRSIAAIMDIRPDEARVLRNGKEETVAPQDVEAGEIIVVRPGEKIPLDGVILEGKSQLDTRSLTGEAVPREVAEGDAAVSGCINVSGVLHLRVTKIYSESTVSKILELVENSSLAKSKVENAVTKFAHWYTPAVVGAAVLLAVVPSLITGDWQRWLQTALIFLVVSCPCALVISVPLSYFGGLGCASRHGVLIKGANWLEALAKAETAVFDKTGTLTVGSFSVTAIHPESGVTEEALLRACAAAEQQSNHPIAVSLQNACKERGIAELPKAEPKELSGRGICAAVEEHCILAGNERLLFESGIAVKAPTEVGTVIYVAVDGAFWGSIVISDRLKPQIQDALSALRAVGVQRTVMLTGDREEVASAVAKELNMTEYRAELLPADKVNEVEGLLKETKGTLVFVGDGVNDAPVLARADVGIAMGALGSDAAIEAADVVLMDDKPEKIAEAIRISRFTRKIVMQNIVFALFVKALFLLLSVFNVTNMWAATFADVGVAVIAILNAMRTLRFRAR